MDHAQCEDNFEQLCRSERIYEYLNNYIISCSERSTNSKAFFPNLAGFCRYLNISVKDFENAYLEYPSECNKILTALEDEALNSKISPNLLSAYLKKRLKYDSATKSPATDQLQIHFEHDIFEDGE